MVTGTTTALLASDDAVTEVALSALGKGSAVDAVAAGVFAAAALHPSVLLGPVQLLIGGAGAGLRAIDGRTRQPGIGLPRPRGFLPGDPIPPAARVGAPALPAALIVAVTAYGKLSGAAVLGPAVEIARSRAKLRAGVLSRIAQWGPAALGESQLQGELTAAAGRLAGGILSEADLTDLVPTVAGAFTHETAARRIVATVPWGSLAVRDSGAEPLPGSDVRVLVAADRHGLVAVACYEVHVAGLVIDALEVTAPFTAAPVLRGQTRTRPGSLRPAAAPIALGQAAGVVDLAAGLGAWAEGETVLGGWLAAYTPVAQIERADPLPPGLHALQRAGASWAAWSGSDDAAGTK